MSLLLESLESNLLTVLETMSRKLSGGMGFLENEYAKEKLQNGSDVLQHAKGGKGNAR